MIEQVWAALGGDPAEVPRLTTTGPGYLRAALTPGTAPLIGFVLTLLA